MAVVGARGVGRKSSPASVAAADRLAREVAGAVQVRRQKGKGPRSQAARASAGHCGVSWPRLNLRAHGETPLFYAARLQRLHTPDLLIDAGADAAIADFQGRDAVDIARARRLPQAFIARLERLRQSGSA